MRAPGRWCDLVLDERIDRFGIRHAEQGLGQTHQRDALPGRETVFGQKGLHETWSRPGPQVFDERGRVIAGHIQHGGLGRCARQQFGERCVLGHGVQTRDFCAQVGKRSIHDQSIPFRVQAVFLEIWPQQVYGPKMTSSSDDFPASSDALDPFDRKILAELATHGRLPVTELARRVGLSKSPTQVRMRRLEAEGFILGYRALLNPAKLGRDHVAFVEVRLGDTREAALQAFNAAVARIPEIEQCHLIAGAFDYLLKVRSADIQGYRHILATAISGLPHVVQTSTHVSMQAVRETGF